MLSCKHYYTECLVIAFTLAVEKTNSLAEVCNS